MPCRRPVRQLPVPATRAPPARSRIRRPPGARSATAAWAASFCPCPALCECELMRSEVIVACLAALSGTGCLANPSLNEVCDEIGCSYSHDEWRRLQQLTKLGPPPVDLSNFADGLQPAIELGRAFFNDPRFSGPASQVDALRRPAAVARAPLGPADESLLHASCHELRSRRRLTASVPGTMSSGAGWSERRRPGHRQRRLPALIRLERPRQFIVVARPLPIAEAGDHERQRPARSASSR